MEIEGWDYAPSQCSSRVSALFYFIPDRDVVSFLNINGNLHVPFSVEGTVMYDGVYFGRVDKQPMTDYHVVFLPVEFIGFPPSNGKVTLKAEFRCRERGVLTCIKNGCCVR
jgi:hypothetical protein